MTHFLRYSNRRQRVVALLPGAESLQAEIFLSHSQILIPDAVSVARVQGDAQLNRAIELVLADPVRSQFEYLLVVGKRKVESATSLCDLVNALDAAPAYSAIGAWGS